MPLIVFTYTEGSLSLEKAWAVSHQIRESMIRNYAVKSIPASLRAHTRMKLIELPRDRYIVSEEDERPLYDVELVIPVDSVSGDDAETFAREVTNAILTAEGAPLDDDNAERVWCVLTEVPDNRFTIGKRVMSRRNVLKHLLRYQSRMARSEMKIAAE